MCFLYFGIRVEVEDANERIFLWGQMQTGDFSFGVRIGVEDAKSLDLLHDFSLSVQTCLSFVLFCLFVCLFFVFFGFYAFKLMHSAHEEMQWQKLAEMKKSPEIAKLTTQSIGFFKGRINEIFVNY